MNPREIRERYPDCETFRFGDGAELSERLLSLVRSGNKTATCGDLREYEAEGEPLPEVGRVDIALNWDGTPALAIKTTEVTLTRFCDVEQSFALAEGENDSLEGWQIEHQQFFERHGGFSPEMVLVCERFKLVADFSCHDEPSDSPPKG